PAHLRERVGRVGARSLNSSEGRSRASAFFVAQPPPGLFAPTRRRTSRWGCNWLPSRRGRLRRLHLRTADAIGDETGVASKRPGGVTPLPSWGALSLPPRGISCIDRNEGRG